MCLPPTKNGPKRLAVRRSSIEALAPFLDSADKFKNGQRCDRILKFWSLNHCTFDAARRLTMEDRTPKPHHAAQSGRSADKREAKTATPGGKHDKGFNEKVCLSCPCLPALYCLCRSLSLFCCRHSLLRVVGGRRRREGGTQRELKPSFMSLSSTVPQTMIHHL